VRRPLVLLVLIISFVVGIRVFPQFLTAPAGWLSTYMGNSIKAVIPTPTPHPTATDHASAKPTNTRQP